MNLWLCQRCRLAGGAADVRCCSLAIPVLADGDRSLWWRTRLQMKSTAERNEIAMWRMDLDRMRASLMFHVVRRGGRWATERGFVEPKRGPMFTEGPYR